MAERLYGFMTLMALFALGLGVWLWQGYGYAGLWLRIKLLLVLGLIGYHLVCRYFVQRLRHERAHAPRSGVEMFNEGGLLLVCRYSSWPSSNRPAESGRIRAAADHRRPARRLCKHLALDLQHQMHVAFGRLRQHP